MIFNIEALNALVFGLALFLARVVYRRTRSIESAVVSGAPAVGVVVILFTPIDPEGATGEIIAPRSCLSASDTSPHRSAPPGR
ncbi:hypothetical protein [Streptomyces solincola]|uniref:hypothetical protein n=1 Tax=Streptomyces solincola TaxID=2100817 RepID=UPI0011B24A33|nr:hypothetical protein [Streptomyces solincola]